MEPSTSSGKDGKVNVAYFSTRRLVDEKTVVKGIGKNRTFANLQENPQAVFMIMEPEKAISKWKGGRACLKMKDFQTSGEMLG